MKIVPWMLCVVGVLVGTCLGMAPQGAALQDAPPPGTPKKDASPACEHLEQWIPAPVIGCVRMRGLGSHLRAFMKSDLLGRIEDTQVYKTAWGGADLARFLEQLARFEEATGMKALDFLDDLIGSDVAVGMRWGLGGAKFTLLSRTRRDPGEVIATIRSAIEKQSGSWPFTEQAVHEGIQILGTPQFHFATIGDVLVVTNGLLDIKGVIDLARGKRMISVYESGFYKDAKSVLAGDSFIGLAVQNLDLASLGFPGKTENIVGALLVGGLLNMTRESKFITARVDAHGSTLSMEIAAQTDGSTEHHACFFPDANPASALRRIEALDNLSILQVRRDFSEVWQQAESYVLPSGVGEMRELDQLMALIFTGRDFGREVLPELDPIWTFVVQNQTFPGFETKPQPVIPSFGIVVGLKHPERFGRNLQAALQTFVGIINADQAQKGNAEGMILVEPEIVSGVVVHAVNRLTPPPADTAPGIEASFTPSLAFVNDLMVITSTKQLATTLVTTLTAEKAPEKELPGEAFPGKGDRFTVDAGQLAVLARQNLATLIADGMMKKGSSREEAAAEITGLIEVIGLFRDMQLELWRDGESAHLRLETRMKNDPVGSAPGNGGDL